MALKDQNGNEWGGGGRLWLRAGRSGVQVQGCNWDKARSLSSSTDLDPGVTRPHCWIAVSFYETGAHSEGQPGLKSQLSCLSTQGCAPLLSVTVGRNHLGQCSALLSATSSQGQKFL